MIKLYYAPRTRSVRIAWLLEELGLPYALERVEFQPPARDFFVQKTPLGKLPTIEDGDVVMGESGAIVEYILERYQWPAPACDRLTAASTVPAVAPLRREHRVPAPRHRRLAHALPSGCV